MKPPTDLPHLRLTPAAGAAPGVLLLRLQGFLDHTGAEPFLDAATQYLEHTARLREMHLDCAGLQGLDSMGLSVLLMLHRRTTAAHVTLRLEHRSPSLDRLLELTGTLDHLAPGGPARSTETAEAGGPPEPSTTNTTRLPPPHATTGP
ncbi:MULTISPECIES: STAS domain-containing protein [Streptomyces]|uniref:STAS domain-containing protein n=1 Tax=Streptomyces apricus TaxID=1828112 RepID=A0A5B0BI33_9ACTN|nr:STAS domain-containing protein [Streptomyces apricus]KAA0941151.1 STAS domain-containing protein [Streptomyces apricus]